MHFLPIHTRTLNPPQDSLFDALEQSDFAPQENDIILVSSKVVAIHQGRCIHTSQAEKEKLIQQEAECYIQSVREGVPSITIKEHTFIGSAGIDESNANGYYVLWPKQPYSVAHELYSYFRARYKRKNIAVILVDSHCIPMRSGTIGISIGFYGIEPTEDHTGMKDIYGREFVYSKSNIVDALAAAAVLVMGETDEQIPVCIARNVPNIQFIYEDHHKELVIDPERDIYYPLLKAYLEKQSQKIV